MAPNLGKPNASPYSSYDIPLDTGGNRLRGLNGASSYALPSFYALLAKS
jgi:hypothetical protein